MPKKFSTKNLEIVEPPTSTRAGVGIFEFTDDYSVFHYGKMAEQIPFKGEAIARMAAFNFGLFERAGIPSHFRGFLEPDRIEFDLLRAPDPAVDPVGPDDGWYMVPLQVVYRNALPEGSSVARRLDAGTVTLEDLGLRELPGPRELLRRPLVEFTTKREEIDRFVGRAEGCRLAGLTEADEQRVVELVEAVDEVITAHAESVGLEHADGKIELGMLAPGELVLVDNAGTPDENRFLLDGRHVGKQVMRDHHLATGLERRVQEWAAEGRPRSTWPAPEPLPPGFVEPLSTMYRALAERWTGESIWGVPPLEDVMETVELLDSAAVRW